MRALPPTDGIELDDDLKEALVTGSYDDKLSTFNVVMLDFAKMLTLMPSSVDKELVDDLRELGADDQLLHDLVQVVAYFNYVNRLADGLGVELEE